MYYDPEELEKAIDEEVRLSLEYQSKVRPATEDEMRQVYALLSETSMQIESAHMQYTAVFEDYEQTWWEG